MPPPTSSKPTSKLSYTTLEILDLLTSFSRRCHIFDILRHVLRSNFKLSILRRSAAAPFAAFCCALRCFAAAASIRYCEIIQDWGLRGDKPDITLLLFVGDTLRSFQSRDPDMDVFLSESGTYCVSGSIARACVYHGDKSPPPRFFGSYEGNHAQGARVEINCLRLVPS